MTGPSGHLPPHDHGDDGRLSFSDVLFSDEQDDAEPEVDEALGGVDKFLDGVSPALRSAARREMLRAVRDVLGSTIFAVVENGWKKYDVLVEAATRTIEVPGATETIEVANHQIKANYEPKVDVFVDEARVGSLEFTLTVSARAASVIAVITAGRLVALRSGHVKFGAVLRAEGHKLAKGKRRVDLVAEMPLGDGIQLASP